MTYFKISFGIFLALAASRFVPHPPNFTSLIALSFYVPAILGVKYLPALIFSFFITDLYIGLHHLTFFTWGSVVLIGLLSKFFVSTLLSRIGGALFGILYMMLCLRCSISGILYPMFCNRCYVSGILFPVYIRVLYVVPCSRCFVFGALYLVPYIRYSVSGA